jgi:hypothetical protein
VVKWDSIPCGRMYLGCPHLDARFFHSLKWFETK